MCRLHTSELGGLCRKRHEGDTCAQTRKRFALSAPERETRGWIPLVMNEAQRIIRRGAGAVQKKIYIYTNAPKKVLQIVQYNAPKKVLNVL